MGIYAILVDSHNLKVKENGQLDYWNGTVDCILVVYSPRKRGLSHRLIQRLEGALLFPAQAGVIPEECSNKNSWGSIPRASGGYPPSDLTSLVHSFYSPRKRGLSTGLHH